MRSKRLVALVLAALLLPATVAVALDEPDVQIGSSVAAAQPAAPWHLDRVDGVDDGTYSYGPLGQGVYVYVIDSGVDHDHPDFTGRVLELPGSDFIDVDVDGVNEPRPCPPSAGGEGGQVAHGTHVASIAAGFGYGLAKEATIVPLRVFNCAGGGGTMERIVAALEKVGEHNASLGYPPAVVNMSLGGACDGDYCDPDPLSAEYDTTAKSYLDAIQPLVDQGIIVVIAAGNSGNTSKPLACQIAPAFLGAGRDGVITVGNMTASGKRNTSSSYGSCVDIYAPGTGVTAADDRDSTGAATIHGTSMAAPMVTGAVALALSENPQLTKEERPSAVWNLLASSAAAFTSDKSPDASIQLRLPERWRNHSTTTATTGYASVYFDEEVSGFDADDITFEGTATGCVAGVSTGPASSYSIAVVCDTGGTVIPVLTADSVVSVADASTAPASNQRLTYLTLDSSAPAVSSSPEVVSISGGQVTYKLEIDEPVFGLTTSDFALSGTASGCAVSRVMGSGAYYTAVVNCTANGTVTLTLNAGTVVDLAGNSGPGTTAAASAFTLTGVPTSSSSSPSGSGPGSSSNTTTTVPAASAGAEAFTPSSTIVPPTSTPTNSASPIVTTPAVNGNTSPTTPSPTPVTRIAEAPRGALRGSTVSVGARRISGSISSANGRPVVVEVQDRKGRIVRTLTVDTRKTPDFTIFVPAGTYRLTLRNTAKGSAPWNLPAVRVTR